MFSTVLVFGVVLIAASATLIDDDSLSREETESERIIGGRNAARGQFPWAAALHFNGQFICTASVISPTTVLTAAHCVYLNGQYQPAEFFYAIANVNKSAPSVRINFALVIPHPDYNDQQIDNDLAILKTTEPIPFNDEVRPLCIARPDTDMNEYKNGTAMGWGNVSPLRIFVIIPDILQYVEQVIVKNSVCYKFYGQINDAKICATGLFNGICNGDSGGPLVHLSANNSPVQIGIASYINAIAGCGKIVPGVWTRVSSHYDFIMQAAGDNSVCTA